jgi:Asp-tRNA(Asn)/Glu-tRNA(Gln) amidotransferase A subunit family amidase
MMTMMRYSLIEDLSSGHLLLPEFLAQVEAHFMEREPAILAFLPEEDRFGRLHEDAETLVLSYPDLITRPSLFGALVGVKDIFHIEGFITQAGSRLPSALLQGTEAKSVTRLKEAGSLIFGKTVTTEFAYFFPGPTRNPHNPEHTPGGSSSGSAAAVAAGFCHLALGTQTIGSIIRPAAFCGVVGFKPTYDRISREGVIPLSPSLDHIGFFTSDVETAKRAAVVLIGDWRPVLNEVEGLETTDRKPTLGIPEGPYLASASDYALARFNAICDSLTESGYELRRVPVMDDFQEIRNRHDVIMSAEAAQVHANWFDKYSDLYSAKFTELIKRGQSVTNDQLRTAFENRDKFRDQITQAMIDNNIDLWISPPTIGPAPKGLDSTGDPVMNLPWTQIGFPSINLPSGKSDDGLPIGLQVVGRWDSDEDLLAWASDLEKVVNKL